MRQIGSVAAGTRNDACVAGEQVVQLGGKRIQIRAETAAKALALAVLCAGLLVWVELAVGIVGPG